MGTNTFLEVMKELEGMGTAQNRKIYKRHGAGENMFGVSFGNLKKLKKKIKKDHQLAIQLWDSGNIDAQTFATMIADPKEMSESLIDKWVKESSYYMVIDYFVSQIVINTNFAQMKMEEWTKSDNEWIGRAGWMLLSHLAMQKNDLENSYFENYTEIIQNKIHRTKNRTKEAMNYALISIGMRNDELEKDAIDTAAKIGKVEVDHGDTSCQTPDAASYIKKAKARNKY